MSPSKSKRTKEALARALEAEMLENPLSHVTVKSVTARAKVDRQTFYYHFKSLDDLVEYLCHLRIDRLGERMDVGCGVAEMFSSLARQVDENREMLRTLLFARGRYMLKGLFHDDAVVLMRAQADSMLAGSGIPDAERDTAVEYCLLASASIAESWIIGDFQRNPDELAQDLTRLFEQQVLGMALLRAQADAGSDGGMRLV